MTDADSWRIDVAGLARRALERLPQKAVGPIVESFLAIGANPHRLGKPLKFELEGLFVARRGPYRIIYEIDAEQHAVTILAIAHRADVCRS